MRKFLNFLLCILIGLTISFPVTYVYEPSYIKSCPNGPVDNIKMGLYILLFPLIFTIVSLSIMIGIRQKCFSS